MLAQEIILIDDDSDDCDTITEIVTELNPDSAIKTFNNSAAALDYIISQKSYPLLILCDINMPGDTGFEFRQLINDTRNRNLISIPFVFISTSGSPAMYKQAVDLNIQGYFIKPSSINDFKAIILNVLRYWESSYRVIN